MVPDAANSQSVDSWSDTAPSRTVTVNPVASAICDASVRCQTSRYSASSWLFISPCTCSGDRYGVVGPDGLVGLLRVRRLAVYCLGCGDR